MKNALKIIIRAVFGHEFYVYHIGDSVKIFPSVSYVDALEWAACALNDDKIKIVNRWGYLVATRSNAKMC